MRVIGTAGHVDHGKSTLIAALTGVHPDRLKEEQEREMTIDLGFGWLTLPDGQELGIVDVPGHRDFIENMLSGIGGIDAVLLVVAADEGVMPQTREHLAILDLLQIDSGLIVVTKTDLVEDPEWLDLVEKDIRTTAAGTALQDAPIHRVSAQNKSGLEALTASLAEILGAKPARPDFGRPRLPIDRIFSMAGFGTVLTGTLNDGKLAIGQEVVILPSGIKGRIRGLQTHKKKEETAVPGSRTAVNVSGIAVEDIRRGEVLTLPGNYQPTRRIDIHLRLLKGIGAPVRHASEVKLFVGASETIAAVRLLGADQLNPGEEGWLQLDLRDPIVTVRGDHFILRRPSPAETLGGGIIVDPHPKGRHKRADRAVIRSLESLKQGTPAEILLEASLALGPVSLKEIVHHSHLDEDSAQLAWRELVDNRQIVLLGGEKLVIATAQLQRLQNEIINTILKYHREHPLRLGIGREELKSRHKLSPQLFNALLNRFAQENILADRGEIISSLGHSVEFNSSQKEKVRALLLHFEKSPFSPPSIKECLSAVGEELLNALVQSGQLVTISPEIIFRKTDYEQMVAKVRAEIQSRGAITVSEVRDLLGSSRKYVLALMEHLDASGVTVRSGDHRRLKQ